MKCARRKLKRKRCVEMREPGDDHPEDCADHTDPQKLREAGDRSDSLVQKKNSEQANQHRKKSALRQQHRSIQISQQRQVRLKIVLAQGVLQSGKQVTCVERKSDATRSD